MRPATSWMVSIYLSFVVRCFNGRTANRHLPVILSDAALNLGHAYRVSRTGRLVPRRVRHVVGHLHMRRSVKINLRNPSGRVHRSPHQMIKTLAGPAGAVPRAARRSREYIVERRAGHRRRLSGETGSLRGAAIVVGTRHDAQSRAKQQINIACRRSRTVPCCLEVVNELSTQIASDRAIDGAEGNDELYVP